MTSEDPGRSTGCGPTSHRSGADAGPAATAGSPGPAPTPCCASGSAARRERRGLDVVARPQRQPVGVDGRPGRGGPGLVTGSHLDSVPDGGAFDGPLGVVSAFAALDRLRPRRRAAAGPWPSPASPTRRARASASPARGPGCSPARSTPSAPAPCTDDDGTTMAEAMTAAGAGPGRARPGRRGAAPASAPSSNCTSSRAGHWRRDARSASPRRSGRTAAGGWTSRAGRPRRHDPAGRPATTRCSPCAAAVLAARGGRRAARRASPQSARCRCGRTASTRSRVGDRLARRPRPARRRRPRRRRATSARGGRGHPASRSRGPPRPTSTRPCATGWPALLRRPGAAHRRRPRRRDPPAAGIPTAMLFVRNPTGVSHSPAEHAEPADCHAGVAALAAVDRGARVTYRTGASTPGSPGGMAMTARRVGIEVDGRPDRGGRGRGRPRARRRPAAGPRAARASRTRTPTPSTGRCAGAPTTGGGTFWTWRERMYAVAARLDPDTLPGAGPGDLRRDGAGRRSPASASSTTSTTRPAAAGTPTRTRWRRRWSQAAAEAGIRLTLLDTCYLAGGLDGTGHLPLDDVQIRFSDGDAEAWAARVARSGRAPGARGSARPCTRCGRSRPTQLPAVAAAAPGRPAARAPLRAAGRERGLPRRSTAARPTRLLADRGLLGPDTTAVHATHLTAEDIAAWAAAARRSAPAPRTEADLADGVGPVRRLAGRRVAALPGQRPARPDRPARRGPAARDSTSDWPRGVRGRFRPAELVARADRRRPPRTGLARRRPHRGRARGPTSSPSGWTARAPPAALPARSCWPPRPPMSTPWSPTGAWWSPAGSTCWATSAGCWPTAIEPLWEGA